ncbi:polysaccharide deacetylase family protein [Ornithinimicrobium sp. Y1694]|uniref:polysaccharide deacetylase family protein n=1 Tax=Ornithinimicrobium sp. Y1694 TaxID=3418590 RepID=UPI003CF349E0
MRFAGGSLTDGPILLASADGRSVPGETRDAIRDLGPSTLVALGGTGAVSDAALQTAAQGRSTGRLAGADRYATAIAIADHAYPNRTSRAYVTRGDGLNLVDAVASGMLTDGPVLLTPGTCEPVRAATASALNRRHPDRVVALGGTGSLCQSTLRGAALDARPTPDCSRLTCVALTFDDGPSDRTPQFLDVFARERVPATFFVIGRKVASRSATVRATFIEGHQIGNHTYEHLRLPTLTLTQQREQLDRTDAALKAIGVHPTARIRPPFLAFDANTRRTGRAVIMADTNPQDWKGGTAAEIRAYIRANVRPGSIIVQHDTLDTTLAAMPGVIADLKAAGYTIVTVDELLPNLRAGDVAYNRTNVIPVGTEIDTTVPLTLDDGRELVTTDTTGDATD